MLGTALGHPSRKIPMESLVHLIVRRMREKGQPLSRNKHFATFAEPEGRAALRLSRLLRSLEHDLGRHGTPVEVQVSEAPGARGPLMVQAVKSSDVSEGVPLSSTTVISLR